MRPISQIDQDINANRKAPYRGVGGKFDVMSAGAWQWAWDRHPDLYRRDVALIHEYVSAYNAREERRRNKTGARAKARKQRAAAFARLARRAASQFQCAA